MAYQYKIDDDRCKGRGQCVSVCPKRVLEISGQINTKGYFLANQARPEDGVFCATCCLMCADMAITITDVSEGAANKDKREVTYG
jgi:2-oxoglutarate ferredoxin oxidoreductase subunit delta